MRNRMSGGRGRPRGRHRSIANIRLLEYLAMISGKHQIDLDDFFDTFVEAWEHQESTCKNLLVECRMKTRNDAVFLITDGSEVVAQFPLPTHILQQASPLKEFAYAKTSRRTAVEETELKHLQIRDLKPGMNRINLKAKVLKIPKPRSVFTKFGEFATVANASITDETGIIRLPLWNKQIDAVSVGDIIQVENARVATFRGERQLRISRGGHLNVVEKR